MKLKREMGYKCFEKVTQQKVMNKKQIERVVNR